MLIYRSFYNQLSETFVRDHVQGLKRFRSLVLANRVDPRGPVDGAPLIIASNSGRLSGALWRWGLACKVDQVLHNERPALIHAHFLFDGASIMPYARRHGIPLVVTAHGYDATLYDDIMAQTAEGRLLLARQSALAENAALIFCVSGFIRDELLARGYPADKLVIQPLGVDTSKIMAAPAEGRRGILTVGRLVEKKGTRFLIEAYALLSPAIRKEHPLTIIGEGPLRAELEARAQALAIAVNFEGPQPREQIIGELARTAVFCLPSIRAASGDAEGMPIAIMEALAVATPTLIFDDQPAAPLFTAQGAGAVARAGDATHLADQLIHLLDPSHSAAMGKRGRALAERTFDITRNTAQLEERYAVLLDGNNIGSAL